MFSSGIAVSVCASGLLRSTVSSVRKLMGVGVPASDVPSSTGEAVPFISCKASRAILLASACKVGSDNGG